ncbi:MAG: hypothetical protein KGJ43_00615 [Acidobacteriota bacterium]|nr:hypothetical protein [Acidobacteriota bacterium]
MTRDEWIAAFAKELGVEAPRPDQVDAILALAGTAAHATERTAAPIAAWLAGVSGRTLGELDSLAGQISEPTA